MKKFITVAIHTALWFVAELIGAIIVLAFIIGVASGDASQGVGYYLQ